MKSVPQDVKAVKIVKVPETSLFHEFRIELAKLNFQFKSESEQLQEFLKENAHIEHVYSEMSIPGSEFVLRHPLKTFVWKPQGTEGGIVHLKGEAVTQNLEWLVINDRSIVRVSNESSVKFPKLKVFCAEMEIDFDLLKRVLESAHSLQYLYVPYIRFTDEEQETEYLKVSNRGLKTLLVKDGNWIIEKDALKTLKELGIDYSAYVKIGSDSRKDTTMCSLERVHLRNVPEMVGKSRCVWPNVSYLTIQNLLPEEIKTVLSWVNCTKLQGGFQVFKKDSNLFNSLFYSNMYKVTS